MYVCARMYCTILYCTQLAQARRACLVEREKGASGGKEAEKKQERGAGGGEAEGDRERHCAPSFARSFDATRA